jgi:hypothetical protein
MGEVLIEFQRNGDYLKCTAVDPVSGEEVCTLGPIHNREALKQLAIQKLHNKLVMLKSKPKGAALSKPKPNQIIC